MPVIESWVWGYHLKMLLHSTHTSPLVRSLLCFQAGLAAMQSVVAVFSRVIRPCLFLHADIIYLQMRWGLPFFLFLSNRNQSTVSCSLSHQFRPVESSHTYGEHEEEPHRGTMRPLHDVVNSEIERHQTSSSDTA